MDERKFLKLILPRLDEGLPREAFGLIDSDDRLLALAYVPSSLIN